MIKMLITLAMLVSTAFIWPNQVQAFDFEQIDSITVIEPTYMPNVITFSVSQPRAGCYWYRWVPYGSDASQKSDNINALYATLLTAIAADKKVRMYVTVNNSGNTPICDVDFLHIVP